MLFNAPSIVGRFTADIFHFFIKYHEPCVTPRPKGNLVYYTVMTYGLYMTPRNTTYRRRGWNVTKDYCVRIGLIGLNTTKSISTLRTKKSITIRLIKPSQFRSPTQKTKLISSPSLTTKIRSTSILTLVSSRFRCPDTKAELILIRH